MLAGADPAFDGPVILFQNINEYCTGRCRQSSCRVSSALSRTMIVFGDYALKTDVQNFDETAVIGSLLHRPIAHLLR